MGILRQRTTTYHPATNGMVERFHRQLKISLKCYCQPMQWMDAFTPWSMYCSKGRLMLYHCRISLWYYPQITRRILHSSYTPKDDPASYVTRLKSVMHQLLPPPVTSHSKPPIFRSKSLDSCTHVFVRHDARQPPLHPIYMMDHLKL